MVSHRHGVQGFPYARCFLVLGEQPTIKGGGSFPNRIAPRRAGSVNQINVSPVSPSDDDVAIMRGSTHWVRKRFQRGTINGTLKGTRHVKNVLSGRRRGRPPFIRPPEESTYK